jgi:hypothetical protein
LAGVAFWVTSDPVEHRRLVRDAIVAHLLKHPGASDTAEGICQWWLDPAGREEDITVVEEALEDLVGGGVMRRRRLPDGGIVYLGGRRIEQ